MTGILTLSDEQYFAADGVSNSILKDIQPPKTPLHFWAKHIAKIVPSEETPALRMGRLVHRCVLQPDTMAGAFYLRPEKLGGRTKDGKAWLSEHTDKPVLSAEESAAIQGMRDSVWAHPMAARLLKTSEYERSAFAEDNGLLLKSRFDAVPRSGNAIVDLKTCESADLDSVNKSVSKYGYYRQAAFYLKVAKLLNLDRAAFVFIFVEKTPPYAVAVYQLDDFVVDAGRMMIARDLQCLRNCRESNKWPGYSDGVELCSLPEWELKQLQHLTD